MALYVAIANPAHGPEERRFYATKQAALRGARRMQARWGGESEVAWCKQGTSDPKVWLAYVKADGITLTSYWNEEA